MTQPPFSSYTICLLFAGRAAVLAAQGQPVPQLSPRTCPAADSAIGTAEKEPKGQLRGRYLSDSETWFLYTDLPQPSRSTTFRAYLQYLDPAPAFDPSFQIHVLLRGKPGERVLLAGVPDSSYLILDGSIVLPIGNPPLGKYTGPDEATTAFLTVSLSSSMAVALAQARTSLLVFGPDSISIPPANHQAFQALYRTAICVRGSGHE